MPISSVVIGNFKGFQEETEIPIKPITVFFGANSSGKSSTIHALACLAQTMRATKDRRPIILDDELAYVHLGRFIEVIHSKSYQDKITLGIGIENVSFRSATSEVEWKESIGNAKSRISFKCSKRTQEILVDKAHYVIGGLAFELSRHGSKYTLKLPGTGTVSVEQDSGFLFEAWRSRGIRRIGRKLLETLPFADVQRAIADELRRTFYLGPFRQPPARRYPTRGASPREVGALGEAAITLLANEYVQSRTRPHLKQIRGWLSDLGLAKSIALGRIGTSDLFDIALELADGKTFPLADLGYGLSQVLPVLVQCSFAPAKCTLLFEQPELHLHPVSADKLSKVFIDTYREKGIHHLIETHSPDLVKALLGAARADATLRDAFVAYKVERLEGRSVIHPIVIEDDGGIYENWERGFNC